MARLPRLYLPGCAQHIIQRGNNRSACFLHDADYTAYLHYLKISAEKYGVAIHAFVLMTNHVHLLATPTDETSIGKMMQSIGRRYVQYFNYTYERSGTLWEGRYKSTIVDTEHYLLTVYRYIELNPVRANMVVHASEYPWSSYQHNAVGRELALLTPHASYMALSKLDKDRQKAYRALFKGRMAEADLDAIREATNKSWVLGSEKFQQAFEALSRRRAGKNPRGGDRKSKEWRGALNQ